ncbi:hypothetical protein MJO29_001645 [Puccinia striiformis f. sp. tritici]|uniref:Hydrophobin n=1 Tax=Puccinia striiformis f. sp. tritici PST-78 TaxID=1165861 RepID=A0A0L0W5P5_9BASI|nr:hypothetical protein Pst134EB_004207 [Puccinia striiformis f. sp. tritici]KAI7965897.1 hypothetical protein MJO29_001645 [Puccinia striiformis f. sp. tritici]KNF06575.1 hypothetical protein PSTG_00448 [Puccinia striiformis f. sp. tritici PST-78]
MSSFAFCKCLVFAILLVMIPDALAENGKPKPPTKPAPAPAPKLGTGSPNCGGGLTTICLNNLKDKISAATHTETTPVPGGKNLGACPVALHKACCRKGFVAEAAKKGTQKTIYGTFCSELKAAATDKKAPTTKGAAPKKP